jgi:hypothetical protein
MAKNFATIYDTGNDAVALEQKVFIKEETTRGTLEIPADADLMLVSSGASVNFTQPIESSPVRSGRHHSSIIKQKTNTEWTLPSLFHIDTSGGVSDTEIDQAYRTLWESTFGNEATGPLTYTTLTPPDLTFSIFENGDLWALQASGSFVQTADIQLPGDGDATVEFGGMSKTALLVGIAKSVIDNNTGNTVTVTDADEGERIPVGAKVMIIEADGTTRSADTAGGTARTVTDVTGAVVTLDGAVLADADGSGASAPIYLSYYEPETPTAINDPQTGLQGTIAITALPSSPCVRSLGISISNNHEPTDFCFGEEGLAGPLFTPGDRFTAEITVELNLNHDLVEFLNKKRDFPGDAIVATLGNPTGRRAEWTIPEVIFPVPEISVPDTGTIPVTFTGNAYTTDDTGDAADELTLKFL